jgi:hypothetical protein
VLAAGYLNTLRLEKRESALRAECAKPEAALGFDLPTAVPADLDMDRPWVEVTADPIFKSLNSQRQERTGRYYFERGHYFVPPDKVPPGANVFDQFDNPLRPLCRANQPRSFQSS